MAFALNSKINIGNFINVKPHEVSIEKSIFSYVDTAKIKVPITSRVVKSNKYTDLSGLVKELKEPETTTAETPKLFFEGDKVKVELGYNNKNNVEFEGFISRLNFTMPFEFECEGYSYQLRKRTYKKTFSNTLLLDILNYLIEGTDILIDEKSVPRFRIEKLILNDKSGTEALEMIKQISSNTIRFYFSGKLLYAGFLYLNIKKIVQYKLGWNTIRDGSLKQREEKNRDIVVVVIGQKKDGSKERVEYGKKSVDKNVSNSERKAENGEVIVIKTHSVTDKEALNEIAAAKYNQLTFNGYEGSITTFGIPFCQPGDAAIISDVKFPSRGGKYIIDSLKTTYGMNGFRRVVGIGIKL